MRAELDTSVLLGALRRIAHPVERPRGNPNVGVRIETRDHVVSLSTTDREVFATAYLDGNVMEEGECVCSFPVLRRLMHAADSRETTLATQGGISGLTIQTGDARAYLPSMDAEAWEAAPEVRGEAAELEFSTLNLLGRVLLAASDDPSRPALNGVHFEERGFVATDGHRLSLVEHDLPGPSSTIPRELMSPVLASPTADVMFTTDGTRASFESQTITWVLPLIAVPFPDYRKIIPSPDSTGTAIDIAELTSVVERVAAVVGGAGSVSFEAQSANSLLVSAENTEAGRIRESVRIDGAWPRQISFRVSYVLDALASMDAPTATVSIEDAVNPVLIRGDRLTHLLMPQRLDR